MISVETEAGTLELQTEEEVFSPSHADPGTMAMLSLISVTDSDTVLDLGCGCGIVGIVLAKRGAGRVIFTDVLEQAAALTRRNAVQNGLSEPDVRCGNAYESVPEKDFTMIVSNPPYHTDFSVAKEFIETGFRKLAVGGKMIMVTKRLDWYRNKLTTVFGGVKVTESNGYYIFIAEKRTAHRTTRKEPKQQLSKKLARRYSGRK